MGKLQEEIVELRKRCDEVDAEREELRSKYESQIKLANKDYEEKMIQKDVLLEKQLKSHELKYKNASDQKEKKYQEKIDILNATSAEKLAHVHKAMGEEMKALDIQHQH